MAPVVKVRQIKKRFVIGLLVISVVFSLWLNEDRLYAIGVYYENEKKLNNVAELFHGLYEPSLYSISYSSSMKECIKRYTDGTEMIYHDDSIRNIMIDISELYLNNADYGCFYDAWAVYDKSGNIQLIIPLKDRRIKVSPGEDARVSGYFLIYSDDAYDGTKFHAFDHSYEKPIGGKWYYWWIITYPG